MTNWAAGMDMTTARLTDSTKSDQLTFTPSFGGLGTGTYTTQSGYYYTIGKIVLVNGYIVINAGGSGSSNLSFNGPPLNPDRTIRQSLMFSATAFGGGNSIRIGHVIAFTGGSGTVWDQISTTQDTVDDMARLKGSDVPSSGIVTIQGWYLST